MLPIIAAVVGIVVVAERTQNYFELKKFVNEVPDRLKKNIDLLTSSVHENKEGPVYHTKAIEKLFSVLAYYQPYLKTNASRIAESILSSRYYFERAAESAEVRHQLETEIINLRNLL